MGSAFLPFSGACPPCPAPPAELSQWREGVTQRVTPGGAQLPARNDPRPPGAQPAAPRASVSHKAAGTAHVAGPPPEGVAQAQKELWRPGLRGACARLPQYYYPAHS